MDVRDKGVYLPGLFNVRDAYISDRIKRAGGSCEEHGRAFDHWLEKYVAGQVPLFL